jgi:hypothetical protein
MIMSWLDAKFNDNIKYHRKDTLYDGTINNYKHYIFRPDFLLAWDHIQGTIFRRFEVRIVYGPMFQNFERVLNCPDNIFTNAYEKL